MEKFKCRVCKKNHELWDSIHYEGEPRLITDMSTSERSARLEYYEGGHILVDKSFNIKKADLLIKVIDKDFYINWEVWVKFNAREFVERASDLSGKSSFSIEGELLEDVYFYDATEGIKISLTYNFSTNGLPVVTILDEDSLIGIDQKNGIYVRKLINWLEQVHHPDKVRNA